MQNIFESNIKKLLGKIIPKSLAIAVSGGIDSLALLYLTSNWVKKNSIELFVFTVNHNLRIEASKEVKYVKNITEKLSHKCIILSWRHNNSKSAIQERAREARYKLMSDKCIELGIETLITGHHFNDAIETYLMRKSKKSGKLGINMHHTYFYNDIKIIRPLFNINKSNLKIYLESNNIQWMEDKSNEMDIYERNRIRKYIKSLTQIEYLKLKNEYYETEKNIKIIGEKLLSVFAESVKIYNYGFCVVDLRKFRNVNYSIQIRIIHHLLTIISGYYKQPRFRNSSKILSYILDRKDIKHTLHGCILKRIGDELFIFRERSAINSKIKLTKECIWDNRFKILSSGNFNNYMVESLVLDDYIEIKCELNLEYLKEISKGNHNLIIFTLPVIKDMNKIVAIPDLFKHNEATCNASMIFSSNFRFRFTHFL